MKTDHFTLLTCSLIIVQDNKKEINITLIFFILKKNRRMRILSAVDFLSLLAGNFATFERILLTGKLMHEY